VGIFLALGIAGTVILAVSLFFDGLLEGVLDVGGAALDGLLSLPVIAGFVSMLGFSGALVLGATGLGTGVASGVGVCAGALAAGGTWRLSRSLMRDGSGTAPRGEDLLGATGSVVTPIPADGYGEVLLSPAGQPVKYSARSVAAVERGAEVWVDAALSPTSVSVRPVQH
jgi:membrane protein implicated in regulation of membrane protease activity